MASVKAHEADRALARPQPQWRVFLFYGPDAGLVSERALRCARAGVDDPTDAFQLIRLDGDAVAGDPLRLVDEANTIGLFGGRRAIRVSSTSKTLLPAVEPLLATPSRDAIVVIEAGDLAKSHPLRLACEKSGSALAVPCYGDAGRDLGGIVDEMLRAAGKEIDRGARETLLGLLGGDRGASRQEIEKLILFAGSEPRIAEADVTAVIGDTAQREAGALVDAVFAGKLQALDLAMTKLMSEGNDPGVLLGFVLRHALALTRARAALDAGKSAREAAGSLRLPYPRLAAGEAALQAWNLPKLMNTVTTLGTAIAGIRRDAELARPVLARTLWTIGRMAQDRGRSG